MGGKEDRYLVSHGWYANSSGCSTTLPFAGPLSAKPTGCATCRMSRHPFLIGVSKGKSAFGKRAVFAILCSTVGSCVWSKKQQLIRRADHHIAEQDDSSKTSLHFICLLSGSVRAKADVTMCLAL